MKITDTRLIIAGLFNIFLISIKVVNPNLVILTFILWGVAYKIWMNKNKDNEQKSEKILKKTELLASEYMARKKAQENNKK